MRSYSASKAPATRRAYRTAWNAWAAWADGAGAASLPAAPKAVGAYLAQRAHDGAGIPTLRMATAAIGAVHDRAGHPNPCADREVKTIMPGLGDGFTGHSGRAGMAQRMTRNGAPAAAVMRQGRWSTVRMVARYTRNESAAEALNYL